LMTFRPGAPLIAAFTILLLCVIDYQLISTI